MEEIQPKNIDKKIDQKIDNLAIMIKKGFDGVDERFKITDEKIEQFREENQREHEEIKIRLDNVAYRFEIVSLEKRVERLEAKAGVA